jgi:acyl-CoA synthetase (AMP-forming)/AMP-acid ligase II
VSQQSAANIFRSPDQLPEYQASSVPAFIRAAARARADDDALVEAATGRSYTYGELDAMIERFAAGITALEFRPGDVLALFAPNLPEWPVAALGAMVAGGAVTGVNPMYGTRELEHQLRDSGARFAFTVPPFLDTVRDAARAAGCETIILLGGDAEGTVSFASVLANTDPEPAVAVTPDDLAALPYSSGTTGMAKGVILTHRALVANTAQINASIIQAYGVTHLMVVPPIMQFLADHPLVDEFDLSSVEMIGCGAASLSAAMEQKVATRLDCLVLQGYGMTESSGVISVSSAERQRPGSSGVLLAGTEARVIDPETGLDAASGMAGEIWFRGPQAFAGYLNNAEATATTITDDGWVRTGDLGYIDTDGFVFLTDRLKELIKVKGFQVPPAELEALIQTHPDVADVGVIGRSDDRSGEVPVAYVVPRGDLDPEALKDWVADQVVEYKQLGDVVITDSIPKNPSGKILHRILREKDSARC